MNISNLQKRFEDGSILDYNIEDASIKDLEGLSFDKVVVSKEHDMMVFAGARNTYIFYYEPVMDEKVWLDFMMGDATSVTNSVITSINISVDLLNTLNLASTQYSFDTNYTTFIVKTGSTLIDGKYPQFNVVRLPREEFDEIIGGN